MSHLVDETYSVYSESRRSARKRHACSACRDAIEPGHRYVSVFIVFDGESRAVKRCLRCQAIHEHLRSLCTRDGDLWPDESLDCGLDYVSEWGELPDDIAALAFQTGADMQAVAP